MRETLRDIAAKVGIAGKDHDVDRDPAHPLPKRIMFLFVEKKRKKNQIMRWISKSTTMSLG